MEDRLISERTQLSSWIDGDWHMSVYLRPINEADINFLFSVYASTRAEEMMRVDWTTEQQYAFLLMQFRAQSQFYLENYPGAEFKLIMQKNQPIGRLYLHRRDNEIRIMDIAILPDYRNAGIGSSLLRDILNEGKELGLSVTIHVEQFNPALHLYQRLGFQPKENKGVYLLLEWLPAYHKETLHG